MINSVSRRQFGFLRNCSTLHQLLIVFNTIANSLSQTDVVYLDFKKAFDSVAHNELLYKLWTFGITDSLWMWFCAYLTDRFQQVSIGDSVSDVLPVISGVPQGSILGPLLFLIFIDDLPASVTSTMVLLFADDAKCVMPITSLADCVSLQEDLNRLSVWSSTWNLLFNEEKCSVISFSCNHSFSSFNYHVNNKLLSHYSSYKDLGVIMSADLQWRRHYQHITSKSYKILGLVRRIFSTIY